MKVETPELPPERELSRFQRGLLVALVVALLGSIGLRAYGVFEHRSPPEPVGAQGVVPDDSGTKENPLPDPLARWLPFVTEGSLFGLIGFALGYASRKLVKLALVLVAVFFVGLQAMASTGTVVVDWNGMLGRLEGLFLDLENNQSMQQFWMRRIPSAVGMVAGYLAGFQRR